MELPPSRAFSELWRLCREPYADLSGEGARQYGGRWNSLGRPLVYLSEEPSLTVLEVLVHLDLELDLIPDDYVLLRLDMAGMLPTEDRDILEQGPALAEESQCRNHGDRWLDEKRSLLLRVPSVIVSESQNILLNPEHALMKRVPKPSHRPFEFDERLYL